MENQHNSARKNQALWNKLISFEVLTLAVPASLTANYLAAATAKYMAMV